MVLHDLGAVGPLGLPGSIPGQGVVKMKNMALPDYKDGSIVNFISFKYIEVSLEEMVKIDDC